MQAIYFNLNGRTFPVIIRRLEPLDKAGTYLIDIDFGERFSRWHNATTLQFEGVLSDNRLINYFSEGDSSMIRESVTLPEELLAKL